MCKGRRCRYVVLLNVIFSSFSYGCISYSYFRICACSYSTVVWLLPLTGPLSWSGLNWTRVFGYKNYLRKHLKSSEFRALFLIIVWVWCTQYPGMTNICKSYKSLEPPISHTFFILLSFPCVSFGAPMISFFERCQSLLLPLVRGQHLQR